MQDILKEYRNPNATELNMVDLEKLDSKLKDRIVATVQAAHEAGKDAFEEEYCDGKDIFDFANDIEKEGFEKCKTEACEHIEELIENLEFYSEYTTEERAVTIRQAKEFLQ